MANLTARMGQQVMNSRYSLNSGVASSLTNRSLGITGEEQALPLDKPRPISQQLGDGNSSMNQATNMPPPAVTDVMKTSSKQQAIAEQAKGENGTRTNVKRTSTGGSDDVPTLSDTEMETLYEGFQKRRRSQRPSETGKIAFSLSWSRTRLSDCERRKQKAAR